ncbi:Metallo-hydrolase/oxidoreductase [Rhodotorula diobovata]|uniref:Metallo-hydrolase/oxidoreductase n=1 Tax=Rhodotorula diobovata TaxID=5288 RepID=A0A5C5G3S7_9BASI|nr:Metallo-hydrolase/oxidoreductase [Rhodotorula diobovata]
MRGPWLARPLRELEDVVEDVRVVQPDWGRRELRQRRRDRAARASGASGADALEGDEEGNTEVICGTWVGHAGAFVEIPLRAPSSTSRSSSSTGASSTLKVLFDPIFSARASPVTWFGPKRMREAPCSVEDLPGVDIVAISHNHYDHLDLATILAVRAKWPRARYFVGLGNKPWFLARGISARQVFEMDWWDEVTLPASVFLDGDTGYRPIASSPLTSPVFSALGRSHGPFDLSFIPIWRGGTLGFISALGLRLCQENLPTATHASPSDAVQIHLDARSRNTVGIHFGTFQGSHLEALEALHALEMACDEAGVRDLGDAKEGKRGQMGRLDIGETLVVEGASFIISLAGSGRELTGRTQCSRRRWRSRVSRAERPALQASHKLPSLEY